MTILRILWKFGKFLSQLVEDENTPYKDVLDILWRLADILAEEGGIDTPK